MESPSKRLKDLLKGPELLLMPCCFDALSARLIERHQRQELTLVDQGGRREQCRDDLHHLEVPVACDQLQQALSTE